MNLVLYPRAAPNDSLRVWVAAFRETRAPTLTWTLNGVPSTPTPLHSISSVRSNDMLPVSGANTPRAFTGVYEFSGLQPDTTYEVTARAGSVMKTLNTRTLPAVVPDSLDRWFNVLLVSCFHQAEDRIGLAGTIVSQMSAIAKPHLTLLAGDQVYLDLPTLKNFPDDELWLADKFEMDYTLNWGGPLAYTEVLGAAPSISVPDDHEYWNNFPQVSPFTQNTFSEGGRERWRRAARAIYEGFQRPYPADSGEAVTINVWPLSFFVADTCTDKDVNRRFTMTDLRRRQLDEWVDHVIQEKMFGVFLCGQSLFGKPVSLISGAVVDYELANYGDYPQIMGSLKRLVNEGRRSVLCLTGDAHWGRVAIAKELGTGKLAFAEVISSPVSLATAVGLDQVRMVIAALGNLFGKRNPWPRHAAPNNPPAFLASDVFAGEFPCSLVHGQRGNHVVLLSFRQHAGGIELRIKYWPISSDATIGQPISVGPIDLTVM